MGIKELLASTPVVVGISLATAVFSIVSISSAITAYNDLNAANSDVGDIIDNWKTLPIVAVEVKAYNENCDSDWELWTEGAEWNGAESANCYCPENAVWQDGSFSQTFATTFGAPCSTNATKADCHSEASIADIDAEVWRRSKICVQRGGESLATWTGSNYERRPYPFEDDDLVACSGDYQLCGAGEATRTAKGESLFNEDRSICFPSDVACPITGMTVSSSATLEGYDEFEQLGDGYYLHYRRGGANELPAVDLAIRLTETDSASGVETRGPCYRGSSQVYGTADWSTSSTAYTSGGTGGYVSNDYPSDCSTADTRYTRVDSYDDESYLRENFAVSSHCSDWTAAYGYMADPSDASIPDPNTRNSNSNSIFSTVVNDCSTSGTSDYTECYMSSTAILDLFDCDGTGNTAQACEDAKDQTVCGRVMAFADKANGDQGLFSRGQIYWEEGCGINMDALKTNEQPLQNAVDLQYTLMVINIMCNVIVGFFFPICVIWNRLEGDVPCIPFDHEREEKLIKWMKTWGGYLFKTIKIVPLFIAIGVSGAIKDFFVELMDENCSDEITDSTFEYLGETIPSVYQSNCLTLGMDLAQLIIPVLMHVHSKCKSDKGDGEEEATKEAPQETEMANPVQVTGEAAAPVGADGLVDFSAANNQA